MKPFVWIIPTPPADFKEIQLKRAFSILEKALFKYYLSCFYLIE